ncbi:hypothetical protein [Zhouia amylolytica]|uniref:DUF4303 domain-containing protein n=1 Tax=Zhouia amylolytica AD3 TaxID=1286632 RepID=W2ULW0_9FLAO|nr:hypothetical protein [Zhouia amylolytica]ETN94287.1 hypothetical protein P278_30910 [Zhouia amylolytica AD3]
MSLPADTCATVLEEYIFEQICKGLEQIAINEKDSIYAYSLYCYDAFADPLRANLTLGYNTIEHYRSEMDAAYNDKEPETFFDFINTPHDDMEAKWNYAFWLQNDIVTIGTADDKKGKELITNWIKEQGFYYTEEESWKNFEACMEKARAVTKQFLKILVKVVQRLHQKFNLKVPILIHQLESFEGITEYNIEANGKSLVKEYLDTYGEYEQELYAHMLYSFLDIIDGIQESIVDSIYAYSLLIKHENNDPRRPTLTIGYNTNSNYLNQIKNTRNCQEAKWNHTYWLHDNIGEIGSVNDVRGRDLIEKWSRYEALFYTYEEYNQGSMECLEKGKKITDNFIKTVKNAIEGMLSIHQLNNPMIMYTDQNQVTLINDSLEAEGEQMVLEFREWVSKRNQ